MRPRSFLDRVGILIRHGQATTGKLERSPWPRHAASDRRRRVKTEAYEHARIIGARLGCRILIGRRVHTDATSGSSIRCRETLFALPGPGSRCASASRAEHVIGFVTITESTGRPGSLCCSFGRTHHAPVKSHGAHALPGWPRVRTGDVRKQPPANLHETLSSPLCARAT